MRPGEHDFSSWSAPAEGQDDFWKKKWCWRWEAPLDGDREPGASSHRPLAPALCPQRGLGCGNRIHCFVKVPDSFCSLNFWIENYASAAVEMQMFGNKIHGLKQTLDRMWISTGLSGPGPEAGGRDVRGEEARTGGGDRGKAKNSFEFLAKTLHFSLF